MRSNLNDKAKKAKEVNSTAYEREQAMEWGSIVSIQTPGFLITRWMNPVKVNDQSTSQWSHLYTKHEHIRE